MSDPVPVKISDLPIAGDLDGSELFPVVQAGTTSKALISQISDARAELDLGYLGIPQTLVFGVGSYTLAADDDGTHILRQEDGTAQDIVVPQNAGVPIDIGFVVTLINMSLAGGTMIITPQIGVNVYLAGTTVSVDKTLSGVGIATLLKVAEDTWVLNGAPLT